MTPLVSPEVVRFTRSDPATLSGGERLAQSLNLALAAASTWPLVVEVPFVADVDVDAVCGLFRIAGWAIDFDGDETRWRFTFAQP